MRGPWTPAQLSTRPKRRLGRAACYGACVSLPCFQVRSLTKQINTLSRSNRKAARRECDGGLSPTQCMVLLAIYILSGFNVALAIEFCRQRSRNSLWSDEDIQTFTENLYLKQKVEDLVRLETEHNKVHRMAVRFLASWECHNFVVHANNQGAPPSTALVAERYVRRAAQLSGKGVPPCLRSCVEQGLAATPSARRGMRRWSQRFRHRWSCRWGPLKAADGSCPQETVNKASWAKVERKILLKLCAFCKTVKSVTPTIAWLLGLPVSKSSVKLCSVLPMSECTYYSDTHKTPASLARFDVNATLRGFFVQYLSTLFRLHSGTLFWAFVGDPLLGSFLVPFIELLMDLVPVSGAHFGVFRSGALFQCIFRYLPRSQITLPLGVLFSFPESPSLQVNLFWRHADWLTSRVAQAAQERVPVYINLDETNVAFAYYSTRGWISKKVRRPRAKVPAARRRGSITHVALISSVIGVQQHLPQILICGRRCASKSMLARLRAVAPSNVVIFQQASSWNTASLMCEILQLVGAVLREKFPRYQGILLFDAAPMHVAPAVVRMARLQQLWLLPVPPSTTQYVQPLDVYVFNQYKRFLEARNRDVRIRKGSVDVEDWLTIVFAACDEFMNNKSWYKAFALVGVPADGQQGLNAELQHFFPQGRTVFPQPESLAAEDLAQLLPKRCQMVFHDWIGAPEGQPPFLE